MALSPEELATLGNLENLPLAEVPVPLQDYKAQGTYAQGMAIPGDIAPVSSSLSARGYNMERRLTSIDPATPGMDSKGTNALAVYQVGSAGGGGLGPAIGSTDFASFGGSVTGLLGHGEVSTASLGWTTIYGWQWTLTVNDAPDLGGNNDLFQLSIFQWPPGLGRRFSNRYLGADAGGSTETFSETIWIPQGIDISDLTSGTGFVRGVLELNYPAGGRGGFAEGIIYGTP